MQTRFNNLIYEHRHDHYKWHPKTRIHRKVIEKTHEPNVCIVCHVAKPGMQFDEFLGGNICDECAMKKELGNLIR